ncbi:hypothetical protein D3C85_1013400 [compost metagenome]
MYAHPPEAGLFLDAAFNARTGGAVLDRVVDEIAQGAHQQRLITAGVRHGQRRFHVQHDAAFVGGGPEIIDAVLQQATQIQFHHADRHGLGPGQMDKVVDEMQGAIGQHCDALEGVALVLLPIRVLRHFHQCQDGALGRAHVMRDEAQGLLALPLGLADARNVGQRGHGAGEQAFGGMDGGAFQDQVASGVVAYLQVGAPGRRGADLALAAQRLGHPVPRGFVGDGLFQQMGCRSADARRAHAQPLEIHDGGLVAESHAAVLIENQGRVRHTVEAVGEEPPQVAHASQRAPQFANPAFQRCVGTGRLGAGFIENRRVFALQAAQFVVHVAQRGFLAAPAPERVAQRHPGQRCRRGKPQVGVGQ